MSVQCELMGSNVSCLMVEIEGEMHGLRRFSLETNIANVNTGQCLGNSSVSKYCEFCVVF